METTRPTEEWKIEQTDKWDLAHRATGVERLDRFVDLVKDDSEVGPIPEAVVEQARQILETPGLSALKFMPFDRHLCVEQPFGYDGTMELELSEDGMWRALWKSSPDVDFIWVQEEDYEPFDLKKATDFLLTGEHE